MNNENPRRIALNILIDIEENKAFSNITINKYLRKSNVTALDRRFISQLVYGVLENKIYLDYIIKNLSKTKMKKIRIEILNILRLGLYQIIFLQKVPDSAAVNESVKLAKKVNFRLSGFVNGILRSYLRVKDRISFPNYDENPISFLSVKYSHPEWLVKKWLNDYGLEFTEKLLEANNKSPNLTVRANTLKISREALIKKLNEEGISCRKGNLAREALIVESMNNSLDKLDSFNKGLFQVQDESSMLVSHILDPLEGEFIIDVCSAPGGKSTHIAQLMNNKGRILSRDIHRHKLDLVKANSRRLGITIIESEQYNALKLDDNLIGLADKVLVDAPCSGFGIIRRKPEIKYLKEPKDIIELSKLQIEILKVSSKYVKNGGILIYSTCTIQDEENEKIIRKFLEENGEFTLIDIKDDLPHNIRPEEKYLQLYPHISNTDGFFICKMKKVE
ncbi:16S rRNA (cytosine(967)-C(5))-methyltransferase RsmB [Maledivibacter halophilus]|uniref:16S rRNA (cytosine(967)-C(5))-methyltransferase n=1 Tax=Maledivibacter halophilus TaxID=36842 RepID=A0A1T5MG64_9FIRM|nr:16S rRNA (cytosine(967)-C(5))-methyltransferase RsmB [Maledivibacter halophilus]SKC87220.1 NusB antitermination factor [Maledivibacter halophilus]